MDYKNYLQTKKGINNKNDYGKTGLKLSGALLLSLAAVQTDAQVIITNVPAANQMINNGIYNINVDGAGGAEFNLQVVPGASVSSRRIYLNGISTQFQVQRSGGSVFGYPYKLNGGALVNGAGGMQVPAVNNSITYAAYVGNWINDPSIGYIGFRFNIGTNVHYGWVELSVVDGNPGPNSLTIKGWGYEATPNTPILTPTAPLPVHLVNFTVKAGNGLNNLAWLTTSEQNNKDFEIQRSEDGKNFEKIGFVASLGDNTIEQEYKFTDADFSSTENFYRLKMVSTDNTFTYSDVVKVINNASRNNLIVLRSNPVLNGQLRFDYYATAKGPISMSVFDAQGKEIVREVSSTQVGKTDFNLNLDYVPAGVYYLKCDQNNHISYEQIIIK